jgi:signal transduction histidine kinase
MEPIPKERFEALVEDALDEVPEELFAQFSNVAIVVEDAGPGVPPEERERIFQRLYRIDKSRSDRSYGLGMSIVNAIVKLHQASVQLDDNQPGLKVTLDFDRAG